MTHFTLKHWTGAAAVAVVLGCAASRVALRSAQVTVADLKPEASPGPKAVLNYNGQLVDARVVHTFSNGRERIALTDADGEILEEEGYVRTPASFLLGQADGEYFEPPMTLLSDKPVSPWSGNLVSGGIKHPATATVTTSVEAVKLHPVDVDATLVTVNLELSSGGKTPAKRTLKFWIARGRGVLQSEFGMGVKRMPAE